jgi:hypothetical protein
MHFFFNSVFLYVYMSFSTRMFYSPSTTFSQQNLMRYAKNYLWTRATLHSASGYYI